MTVSSFTDEFFFLDPTYPFPVDYKGISYSCMQSALVAAFYPDKAIQRRIAMLDGYSAMRYKPASAHLSMEVMREITAAKFNDEDGYIHQMFTESTSPDMKFVYENNIHDNYLGVCTCSRCKAKNIQSKNILGKLLTELRNNT